MWLLKGGFALDLRLAERARTTKDIDLAWRAPQDAFLETLLDATTCDLDNFFVFSAGRTNDPPDRLGGTHRFRIAASLAGRPFETFMLDVGHDHNPAGDADLLTTPSLLSFAGIEPIAVPALPLELQVSEKLHAYTRVYEGGRMSSRTKDLVDLVLIACLFSLDAAALCSAIETTFEGRTAHVRPPSLPAPPALWRTPFREMASAVGVDGISTPPTPSPRPCSILSSRTRSAPAHGIQTISSGREDQPSSIGADSSRPNRRTTMQSPGHKTGGAGSQSGVGHTC